MLLNSFSSYSSGGSVGDAFGAMYVEDIEKIKNNFGETTNGITFNRSSAPTNLTQILDVSGSGIFLFNGCSVSRIISTHTNETLHLLLKITIDNHVVSNILYRNGTMTSSFGVFTIVNVPWNLFYDMQENHTIYFYKCYEITGSVRRIIQKSISNDDEQILVDTTTANEAHRILDAPLKFNSNLKIEAGASFSGAKDQDEKINYNYIYILE